VGNNFYRELIYFMHPIFAIIGCVFCHLILFLKLKFGPLKSLIICYFATSLFLLILNISYGFTIIECISNFIFFSTLWYGYFNYFNIGEASLRIRVLSEISKKEEGISYEQILSLYNAQEIVKNRLTRLVNDGQVVLTGGRYYLGKPKLVILASFFQGLSKFVLGKKSFKF